MAIIIQRFKNAVPTSLQFFKAITLNHFPKNGYWKTIQITRSYYILRAPLNSDSFDLHKRIFNGA